MSILQVGLLVLYAAGMALGQVMFKQVAVGNARAPGQATLSWLAGMMVDPWFVAASATYLGLSVAWVWILSFTPLSRAYPFVALAIVATPVLGHLLFGEPLSLRFFAGTALVVGGLLLIVR